ncbi:hypothetical protein HQ576_13535 [bacterium]|nr:hypothetical protein [bacterium]
MRDTRRTSQVPLSWLPGLMLAAVSAAPAAEVTVRDEIFGNKEAAEMVMQARRFDPGRAGPANADREKAVALYEQAMALQPGAPMNAALANRIAQLYGYYGNRRRGIWPDNAKALHWWTRCIALTNSKQILWGEAQMGLGCMRVITRKPRESAANFKAILNLDVAGIEWPPWRTKPDTSTAIGREQFDREMIRRRDRAEELHVKAVEKIHYVLIRVDGAAAISMLLEIAKEYGGLPAGDRAAQLAQAALKKAGPGVYRYRDLERAAGKELLAVPKGSSRTKAAGKTEAEAPVPAVVRPPVPAKVTAVPKRAPVASRGDAPAAEEASDGNPGRRALVGLLGVAALALLALVMVKWARARRARR